MRASRHTDPNEDAEARGSATRPRDGGAIQAADPHPMALAGDPPPRRTAGRDAGQPDVSSPPVAVLGGRLARTSTPPEPAQGMMMPRYFFNVSLEEHLLPDPEGQEL